MVSSVKSKDVAPSAESERSLENSLRQAVADIRSGEIGRQETRTVEVTPVAALRRRLGYSQEEFAAVFQVSVATIRNWEQGRRQPSGAAPALLKVIEAMPNQVREVLEAGNSSF